MCVRFCFSSAGEDQPISSSDAQSSLQKGRTVHAVKNLYNNNKDTIIQQRLAIIIALACDVMHASL